MEADPGSRRTAGTVGGRHHTAIGLLLRAAVLGSCLIAPTAAAVVVASVGRPVVTVSLPPVAAVAPRPLTAKPPSAQTRSGTVTVVAPLHRVEVYDIEAGRGALATGPPIRTLGGSEPGAPDPENDTSAEQSGTWSPGMAGSAPPSTVSNPPSAVPTTTTTTVHRGQSDDGSSDDKAPSHSGSTTTTSPRSHTGGSSSTTTTGADG